MSDLNFTIKGSSQNFVIKGSSHHSQESTLMIGIDSMGDVLSLVGGSIIVILFIHWIIMRAAPFFKIRWILTKIAWNRRLDKLKKVQQCIWKWINEKRKKDSPFIICLVIGIFLVAGLISHICLAIIYSPEMLTAIAVRNYIFAIGGLIAFYSLSLAARRTRIADSQLFSERLGRGTDLLVNDKMNMRRTGVLVLEDLANKSTSEDKRQIIQIIHDFIIANSQPEYRKDKDGNYVKNKKDEKILEDAKPREKRFDIEFAIKTLTALSESSNVKSEEILFNKIDLRLLDFSEFKTNLHLYFQASILDKAEFFKAKLNEANFFGAELNGARFFDAKLNGAFFSYGKLNGVRFAHAELNGSHFNNAKLNKAIFVNAILNESDFSRAKLNEGNFWDAELNKANFANAELREAIFKFADCSETDFRHTDELTQEQVDQMIFEEGREPRLPEELELELPEDHAYVWEKDEKGRKRRRFIKSEALWSEWWVDEWSEEHLGEWF